MRVFPFDSAGVDDGFGECVMRVVRWMERDGGAANHLTRGGG